MSLKYFFGQRLRREAVLFRKVYLKLSVEKLVSPAKKKQEKKEK